MAVQGSVTVGMIASFVNYSRQFSRPISQMANLVNTILSAIAGAERVFAIMDEQPDVTNKPNALLLQNLQETLLLRTYHLAILTKK